MGTDSRRATWLTIEALPGDRTRRTNHGSRGAALDYAWLMADTNGAGVVVEHWEDDRLRDRQTVYWAGQDPWKEAWARRGGRPTD